LDSSIEIGDRVLDILSKLPPPATGDTDTPSPPSEAEEEDLS
jgi:hypothetical protein